MIRLHGRVRIRGTPRNEVLKVVTLEEFISGDIPSDRCALWYDGSVAVEKSRALEEVGWGVVLAGNGGAIPAHCASPVIEGVQGIDAIRPGAVVVVNAARQAINVVYRRGSRSNSLLVTERCNSYCIMCSQPPVEREEGGRVRQLTEIVELIDDAEAQLGLTGGEPTLLGDSLVDLLRACGHHLPTTHLHVLTNGRAFQDECFVNAIARVSQNVTWAIPVYSDAPEVHDYVVQRRGAYDETLRGLIHLGRLRQSVEIRVVLQREVVPRLRQLAHFITRNLSFVDHVAWMGLEPTGFARGNWNAIWIEPDEYKSELHDAVTELDCHGIRTSIYNLPLCVLPRSLWPFAAQSISDWKNEYRPACEGCSVRDRCCGFFGSVGEKHLPRAIRPVSHPADVVEVE